METFQKTKCCIAGVCECVLLKSLEYHLSNTHCGNVNTLKRFSIQSKKNSYFQLIVYGSAKRNGVIGLGGRTLKLHVVLVTVASKTWFYRG